LRLGCSPRCGDDPPPQTAEVAVFHDTEARAEKHPSLQTDHPLITTDTPRKEDEPSLFHDPAMTPRVDFNSNQGFTQAAGKKGKKKAAQSGWEDEEKKKEEGAGEDNNGGGKGFGDTGAGAGDAPGNNKDDANGDGDAGGGDPPADDDWGSFAPAKSKKKGKKGAKVEEPTPAAAPDPPAEKFDAFHEIKLDDGPGLDLSFDTGFSGSGTKSSASGVGTWGSSWATGDSKTAKTSR
jgi:hypothetical protein